MNLRDPNERVYRHQRQQHWDRVAQKLDHWGSKGSYYQKQLASLYSFLVPTGQRVLEIGCGLGDLLAAMKPSLGIGIDFSGEMLHRAAKRFPELIFIQADAHALALDVKFDFIILSDLVNDLWDVQSLFENLGHLVHPRTRLILNTYSLVWEPILKLAQRLGWSKPNLEQNWLTVDDLKNLFMLTGYEVIKRQQEILFPLRFPIVSTVANRFLVKVWPFLLGAMTNFIIARPQPDELLQSPDYNVSVIIPARNEEGNIEKLFERVPEMGNHTELIFVEGHSTDGTYEAIEKAIKDPNNRHCKLFKQSGTGKGDAVRVGFEKASGDILMILDADMTVSPEDLVRFYQALISGKGELINGVRLVYPVEDQAMRFLNLAGNKFFSVAFSWLLGQPVKDTLCGTKVLWREDYQLIAKNRSYFGQFDPFGDFDLLFGAARLNLKLIDMPIRYRSRKYGKTNIHRWRHGWLLLRMVFFAARRIKFV